MKRLVGEKCHGKTKTDPAVRKPSVVRKSKNIWGRRQVLRWAEVCECGIAFWRPWASCFLMLLFACFSVVVEKLMFIGCLLTTIAYRERTERQLQRTCAGFECMHYTKTKKFGSFFCGLITQLFLLAKWGWHCSEDSKHLRPHLKLNPEKLCL